MARPPQLTEKTKANLAQYMGRVLKLTHAEQDERQTIAMGYVYAMSQAHETARQLSTLQYGTGNPNGVSEVLSSYSAVLIHAGLVLGGIAGEPERVIDSVEKFVRTAPDTVREVVTAHRMGKAREAEGETPVLTADSPTVGGVQ